VKRALNSWQSFSSWGHLTSEVSKDRMRIGYPAGYLQFFGSGTDLDIYFEKKWIRTRSGYLFDFYNKIFLRVV